MESEIEKLKRLMGVGRQREKNVTNINETKKIKQLIESLSGGGKGDIMYYIAKGLGFPEKTAISLRNNIDNFSEASKEISLALEKAGLDDIGKLQSKLKSVLSTKRTSDLTDNEIKVMLKEYFKQYPEQAKQILLSTSDFTDKVVSNMSLKDIFSKNPEIIEGLEYIVSPSFKLDETNIGVLKNNIMVILNGLKKLPQTGNIKEVTDLIETKFDVANLMDNFKETNKKASSAAEDFVKNVDDEFIEKLNSNGTVDSRGWYYFGPKFRAEEMSGWKFHIFGETLEDSAFLIEKLRPVAEKYNAHSKVGGPTQVNLPSMKPGTDQHGKTGVCMYIPNSVVKSGKQREMLSDIQSAISGYKKGGNIKGDQPITTSIHYRYELKGPIKQGDINNHNDYLSRYNENSGGDYKPDNVIDLFATKNTVDNVSNNYKINRQLYDEYIKNGGDQKPMYDWFNSLSNKEMNDIYKYIEEKNINSVVRDQSNKVNLDQSNKVNWYDMQPPNQPRSPYEKYGAGSN